MNSYGRWTQREDVSTRLHLKLTQRVVHASRCEKNSNSEEVPRFFRGGFSGRNRLTRLGEEDGCTKCSRDKASSTSRVKRCAPFRNKTHLRKSLPDSYLSRNAPHAYRAGRDCMSVVQSMRSRRFGYCANTPSGGSFIRHVPGVLPGTRKAGGTNSGLGFSIFGSTGLSSECSM